MDYYHLHKKLQPSFDLIIPFLKFNKELTQELLLKNKKILFSNDKFILTERLTSRPIWAQDWWSNCEISQYQTKSELHKILKSQKNLGIYFNAIDSALANSVRREQRELKTKRIDYTVPSKFNFKYYAWTILEDNCLLLCKNPTSQFPLGWHEFNEDKNTPPNRAYLKLWEILCLGHIQLRPNDIAIELGSSPGGWSWALSQQIKKVYSVDKALLSPEIAGIKSIEYQCKDAFKLNPSDYPDCTWLFSDIICTPTKLLELVQMWLTESVIKNFVCTIKFKGSCDFDILNKFAQIENSKLIHLYQNKNEVTWIKQRLL